QSGSRCARGMYLLPSRSQETPLQQEEQMTRSHPSHFPKAAAGACMITSPLFLLASSAVSPPLKSGEGAQLAAIAHHPDRDYWFILLGLVGTVLLVPAVLGLMHVLRERAPGWGYIGGSLALVGTLLGLVDW